jgi:hypothetical protein
VALKKTARKKRRNLNCLASGLKKTVKINAIMTLTAASAYALRTLIVLSYKVVAAFPLAGIM